MRQTLAWLWGMAFNPELVWENPDGTFSHTEKVARFRGPCSRWDLRPMWFNTFLTTESECGCLKRLGIKRTLWCMDCAGINLGDES